MSDAEFVDIVIAGLALAGIIIGILVVGLSKND